MLLWLAIIALLDIGYSRWDYAQKLRMSRREVKDEVKQREGDPRIRARMCELRREMLKRSTSVKRVKDADVLITNPTHFAVALRYRRGADAAPRVVAKGHAELAAAMVAAARRARVPVIRNPALARALFATTDLEREIPESSYADVARILAAILNAPAHARAGG
jgi:flagellar biosynthetic protein FlhB